MSHKHTHTLSDHVEHQPTQVKDVQQNEGLIHVLIISKYLDSMHVSK